MAHELLTLDSLDDFKIKLTRRIVRFHDNLKNKIKFVRLETSYYKSSYIQDLDKLIYNLNKICPAKFLSILEKDDGIEPYLLHIGELINIYLIMLKVLVVYQN
jgi:hypothetical protein